MLMYEVSVYYFFLIESCKFELQAHFSVITYTMYVLAKTNVQQKLAITRLWEHSIAQW